MSAWTVTSKNSARLFTETLNTPNAVTIAAMQEAERIARDPNAKRYSDVEEALRELKK